MARTKFITITAFLLTLLVSLLFCPTRTLANTRGRQVVIFVLDSITLDDLVQSSTPHIDSLMVRGGIGLMNTTTAGAAAKTAAHLTIGAGARAAGNDAIAPAVESTEVWQGDPVEEVYRRRSGIPPRGEILHLGLGEIRSSNSLLSATVIPGALGQTLANAGLVRAVIGNADYPGCLNRPAVGIIMDTAGTVDEGSLGPELLQKNPKAPFGWEIKSQALLTAFQKVATASVIVIDWGDTTRANLYSRFLLPGLSTVYRQRAIERADAFLGQLLTQLDLTRTLLLLVVPSPPLEGYRSGDRLTPLVLVGAGLSPGLLSSPTTRRHGLVANIDLAPTILRYFRLPVPRTMVGRPIEVIPTDNPLEHLSTLHQISLRNYVYRPIVIKSYIVFILLVLAGTTLVIYHPLPRQSLWEYLLMAVATIPLALLILPLLSPGTLGATFFLVGILSALAVQLFHRHYQETQPFIFLALATTGLLALDILTGQHLQRNSLLGYCPISGARYYGIGNEYMGVLLGASLVGFSGLAGLLGPKNAKSHPLLVIVVGFLVTFSLLASPHWGANLGGTIAAMGGYGMTIMRLRGQALSRRHFFPFAIAGLLLLLGLGLGDFFLNRSDASHLGQTAALILARGPGELLKIGHRKLGMNLKLLKCSWWSLVLLITLLLFTLLSFRPPRSLLHLTYKYPHLWAGLAGSGSGALLAFLANDSGVVAAATTLIFPVTTLLFLLLRETRSRADDK